MPSYTLNWGGIVALPSSIDKAKCCTSSTKVEGDLGHSFWGDLFHPNEHRLTGNHWQITTNQPEATIHLQRCRSSRPHTEGQGFRITRCFPSVVCSIPERNTCRGRCPQVSKFFSAVLLPQTIKQPAERPVDYLCHCLELSYAGCNHPAAHTQKQNEGGWKRKGSRQKTVKHVTPQAPGQEDNINSGSPGTCNNGSRHADTPSPTRSPLVGGFSSAGQHEVGAITAAQ